MGNGRPIAILALLVGAIALAVVGQNTASYIVAALLVGAAMAVGNST